ncbi:MAG TPA: hypothetical protein VGH27_07180 [Streptosporangiaceae bacterium]
MNKWLVAAPVWAAMRRHCRRRRPGHVGVGGSSTKTPSNLLIVPAADAARQIGQTLSTLAAGAPMAQS